MGRNIQVLHNAVGGVSFPGKKHYEGVRFNISVTTVTRGVGGGQITRKTRYVTLEWPLPYFFFAILY